MTRNNVLCKSCRWYLLREKKKHFKPRPKTGSRYPVVFLFKTSHEHPGNFYMGVFPPPPPSRIWRRISDNEPEHTDRQLLDSHLQLPNIIFVRLSIYNSSCTFSTIRKRIWNPPRNFYQLDIELVTNKKMFSMNAIILVMINYLNITKIYTYCYDFILTKACESQSIVMG